MNKYSYRNSCHIANYIEWLWVWGVTRVRIEKNSIIKNKNLLPEGNSNHCAEQWSGSTLQCSIKQLANYRNQIERYLSGDQGVDISSSAVTHAYSVA